MMRAYRCLSRSIFLAAVVAVGLARPDLGASAQLEAPRAAPALVERAIRNSSKSRDVVLDPFGGSGSTLIACERTGRQARLVELDPKYCDVIVQRWLAFAGGAANLDGDGRSYEEIDAGREAASHRPTAV